jgi:hypothetical protein
LNISDSAYELCVWNLLRNDSLTNFGCLHIVIAEEWRVPEPFRISLECKEMEEAQIASSSKNEREGKDVNFGVEGSNSNGHRKEMDKEGHMMKIIEGLQKEAQTRQAR